MRMWGPWIAGVVDRHRVRLGAGMKDEHDGAARFRAGIRNRHGQPLRNQCGPTGTCGDDTLRRFQTLRAAHDVPGFGAWMAMTWTADGLRARGEHRLHVPSRVWLIRPNDERPNDGDLFS